MDNSTQVVPARFDPKQAHVVAQWPAGRPLVCCRFEPKGRFVFGGLESATIPRFNLTDGKTVPFAGGHDSWVFALAFSPDGETIYSGGGDGRVAVWETAAASSPKPVRKIEAHRGWVRALGMSPDGTLLATGGNDRMVRLWETSSGSLVREFGGHLGHVYSLEFPPGGKTLLSGDLLGAMQEWDLGSGKAIGHFDAKALHTYDGGQQVRLRRRPRTGGHAGWPLRRGRGVAQSHESPRGRPRTDRAGLRCQESEAGANPAG